MRLHAVLLVAIALALAAGCQRPQGRPDDAPAMTGETLLAAWKGQWMAPPGGGAEGPVELILTRVARRDTVMGQFTFVIGGTSRTLRYEGRLEDGTIRFPLVGDGRIVLHPRPPARPSDADSLQGEWVDRRGALPGPEGVLKLGRVR